MIPPHLLYQIYPSSSGLGDCTPQKRGKLSDYTDGEQCRHAQIERITALFTLESYKTVLAYPNFGSCKLCGVLTILLIIENKIPLTTTTVLDIARHSFLIQIFLNSVHQWYTVYPNKREREMFSLTTHSTHFIYGYMASDIWLRTILIVRKETRCRHIGYSYRLAARVLLYAPSHRQDNTYHGLCYTSRGALAGTRNSSMGPLHEGSIRRPTAP